MSKLPSGFKFYRNRVGLQSEVSSGGGAVAKLAHLATDEALTRALSTWGARTPQEVKVLRDNMFKNAEERDRIHDALRRQLFLIENHEAHCVRFDDVDGIHRPAFDDEHEMLYLLTYGKS